MHNPHTEIRERWRSWLLLLSVFLMVASGIVYELLIAAYSAHLQGDSIYQFSLTIGLFMSAMGVGSYFTQHLSDEVLVESLCDLQLAMALLGGATIVVLSLVDIYTASYRLASHIWTVILGALVGFQLPVTMRIIEVSWSVKRLLAQVLLLDYVGALAGSLLLPWVLMPRLGFANASLLAGALCLLSFCLVAFGFFGQLKHRKLRLALGLLVGLLLFGGWGRSERLLGWLIKRLNPGVQQVYLTRSPYQELRFVRYAKSYFLTLNRQIQFSTQDEQRYHEALVHPAMLSAKQRHRVLLLGGGDGLALREIWRYHDVREVVMVDLDPAMTRFGRTHPIIRRFNRDSLRPIRRRTFCLHELRCPQRAPTLLHQQPTQRTTCAPYRRPSWQRWPASCKLHTRKVNVTQRLRILNQDAWKFAERQRGQFSVIISDLPDATNISLSKLYSVEFYRMLHRLLAPTGAMTVQSTAVSPAFRRGYWCIVNSIAAAGFSTRGYHVWVPSFGFHTGFTLAAKQPPQPTTLRLRTPTRYLNQNILPVLFWFPKDISAITTPINRIDTHILLRFLLRG